MRRLSGPNVEKLDAVDFVRVTSMHLGGSAARCLMKIVECPRRVCYRGLVHA